MKKLLLVFALGLGLTFAQAQTVATTNNKATTTHAAKSYFSKIRKEYCCRSHKKGWYPDKRFKEHKNVKAQGPKKADGTPDMRYKSNKPAAKK
ncbi:MAG: hypothetical protein IPJ93_00675 [Bacteroidota bacterium]|nr:MAG: hypothetical protein IPJ93_00675 [Bacteroidota bacterium]